MGQAGSPIDLVGVLDVSLSMRSRHGDFLPSKLEAAKDALVYVASRVLDSRPGSRVGLVVFYGYALPVLPLTPSLRDLISTLSEVRFTGEGSAPGDGLVAAVKLLRGSRRRGVALLLTDGGFNEGVRLDAAALYAFNSGVEVCVITMAEGPQGDNREILESLSRNGRLRWRHAPTKVALLRESLECVMGIG